MTLSVQLPEVVVSGKRLGRNLRHDPQSLRYLLPESAAASVTWERHIPILDQGNIGACTGNALTGALATGPLFDAVASLNLTLDEQFALGIYSAAEKLDGGAGLPTEDQGSSGLSVATVAKTDGYISGYQHATSVGAANTAIAAGPFIQGTYWFTGMDSPTSEGIVTATGTVRGGHEYMCRQYDAARDLWWYDNSWGTQYGIGGRFAMSSETLVKLLGQHGDITSLVPLSQPAPIPTPTPAPSSSVTRTFTATQAGALDFMAQHPHAHGSYLAAAAQAWEDSVPA